MTIDREQPEFPEDKRSGREPWDTTLRWNNREINPLGTCKPRF
jgi:hypothetical protein